MYDLAEARYDVDRPSGPSPVERSYVICSNPRSGSTLLAEGLHATGRLGTPLEYFDGTDAMHRLAERWGCRDLACYLSCLHRHRTTTDGIIGGKVHWYQLQEMALTVPVEPLPGPYGHQRAALHAAFPFPRYVLVVRADRDRQAVSWARAKATQAWYLGDPRSASEKPPYDFEAIDACRRDLEAAERGWEALFAAGGVAPLTVTYEQLVADYAGTVAAVAAHLGVELDPSDVEAPRLRKQSDDWSARMLERYRAERAPAG